MCARRQLRVKAHWVRNGQTIDVRQLGDGKLDKPTKPCAPRAEQPAAVEPAAQQPAAVEPAAEPARRRRARPRATRRRRRSRRRRPGEPTPIVDADCDSITLGLDNPANGVAVKLDFETSKGEKRSVTVAPGEKKTEKFSATEGFKVTVTVAIGEKSASETVTYQKPEDCAAGGASGGGLALTGAAAGEHRGWRGSAARRRCRPAS